MSDEPEGAGGPRGTGGRRATARRRSGDAAEALVVARLAAAGWRILGRQVRVGRDELDIVAVDPGAAGTSPQLVVIEVRSSRTGRFGAPEESVAGRKIARTWRAAVTLVRGGRLPDGTPLPRLPWRVDLVSVDIGPALGRDAGGTRVRHLRNVAPA